jgi:hypothetical protein
MSKRQAFKACLLLIYKGVLLGEVLLPKERVREPYFTVNANVVLLNSVWSALKERSLYRFRS